ncbi:MAG: hypothetical protein Q9159_003661 [Coniocarpon cinnabarinum]
MTDFSAAARLLLPRVPLMLKTGVSHVLSLSEESSKWDLKTALLIATVRSIMAQSTSSVTQQQRFSLRDPGVKGPMWVVPITLGLDDNEDDIRQLLFRAVEDMNETGLERYEKCILKPVEAEWQAHRKGVSQTAQPPPNVNNEQMFAKMCDDLESDGTILYFHGGAHYLMDPSSHRPLAARLCEIAGCCRALSIRYRLSPQNPFPAAILDSLVAYLSLLYPHTSSLHQASDASKIVFAGDSAGGNISMALLQLLLHLRRKFDPQKGPTLRFNGRDIPLPLPLPAGVATNAAWSDFTRSSPSNFTNAHYDYLPLPAVSLTATPASSAPITSATASVSTPSPWSGYKVSSSTVLPQRNHRPGQSLNPYPCDAWPATPPRAELYCEGESLCHPLVSPLIVPAEHWRGACPLFFECGEEELADEVRALARRAASVGVPVRWIGFEAMPHCFAMMIQGTETSAKGIREWGEWIGKALEGRKLDSTGTWVRAKTLTEESAELEKLTGELTDEEIFARMRWERQRRCDVFRALVNGE